SACRASPRRRREVDGASTARASLAGCGASTWACRRLAEIVSVIEIFARPRECGCGPLHVSDFSSVGRVLFVREAPSRPIAQTGVGGWYVGPRGRTDLAHVSLFSVPGGLAAPGAPSPKQVSRYLPPGVRRACAALSPSSVTGVTSCACSSGRVVGLSEDRGVEADKAARSGAGTGAGSTGTSVDLRRSRSNGSQRANAWETRRSDESTVNYSSGSNGFVISRSPVRLRRVALGFSSFSAGREPFRSPIVRILSESVRVCPTGR